MSSSESGDDPELNLTDEKEVMNGTKTVTTGTSILNGMVDYISAGGSIVSVLQASVVGVLLSPFLALSNIIQAIGSFFTIPFTQGGIAIGEMITALFSAPAGLIQSGTNISENALSMFFSENLAGILALPVAVGVVLLSLFLVSVYLNEEETGDTLPGTFIDVPDIGPLQLGVEEEDEED